LEKEEGRGSKNFIFAEIQTMTTLDHFNFAGKKALIRVDFNVPLNGAKEVTDDTRIRAALPTIKKVLADGGSVILMSHLGRPKGSPNPDYSLSHVIPALSRLVGTEVKFAGDCIGETARNAVNGMKSGQILLLENLRFYKEEEKGDEEFARSLAELGDIYVNDAFGTAHRPHASTTIIARFFPGKKCFGFLMAGEVKNIQKVMNKAEKPFTAILGGAKVSDKILILEKLLERADHIVIGGGMAFTFVKAMGGKTGKSLVEDDRIETAKQILNRAAAAGVSIHIPVDSIIADSFSNEASKKTCDVNAIPEGWMGLDIGPETEKNYEKIITGSKTILWNGPMGVFEMENFSHGTRMVAEAIVKSTDTGAYSLIGGGDSVAAINKYRLSDKVSYVSTGGGAMLEFIEKGSLPGVEAIEQ
jgi:phosphoglycerate kinase